MGRRIPKLNTLKIKGLISQKGITQAALAEAIGISPSTLNLDDIMKEVK